MMTESNKKLIKDMKVVLSDLEQVLGDFKDKSSKEAMELKDRLDEKLESTKEKLIIAEQDLLNKEQVAAEMTDSYVRSNAWKIIIVVALVSFFIGHYA
ncbi:MAG: DUF883 family protein [Methylophilaceae bacterium]